MLGSVAGRVLVTDDARSLGAALVSLLGTDGHAARHAATADEGLAGVRDEPTDLVLLDLRLGRASGLELLPRLKALRPEMSVIVVTALGTIDTVVEAMKLGADNFVVKPIDEERLLALVGKGLEAQALRVRSAQLDHIRAGGASELYSGAAAMRRAVELVEAAAAHDTTVLLLGETGSGKGVLARHLH